MITSILDLVVFLKRFHRHRSDDPSLDPGRIPADLPDGLATIYREFGSLVEMRPGTANGRRLPFAAQDVLIAPSRLKYVKGMVEFARESQDCWSARCPVGRSDPPVYSNAADLWGVERRGFVVVCESLNHFLTTLCLREAVMSCRYLTTLDADRPAMEILSVPLRPLWLDGYYVAGEPDHYFYATPDRDVLVMENGDDVWVGSPDRKVTGLAAPDLRAHVHR